MQGDLMNKKSSSDVNTGQAYRSEEDFLFGQITASQLQEFKVIKFNKKNKP